MRNLYIQGVQITDIPSGGNIGGVVNGSCSLQDRSDILLCIYSSVLVCFLEDIFVFRQPINGSYVAMEQNCMLQISFLFFH